MKSMSLCSRRIFLGATLLLCASNSWSIAAVTAAETNLNSSSGGGVSSTSSSSGSSSSQNSNNNRINNVNTTNLNNLGQQIPIVRLPSNTLLKYTAYKDVSILHFRIPIDTRTALFSFKAYEETKSAFRKYPAPHYFFFCTHDLTFTNIYFIFIAI